MPNGELDGWRYAYTDEGSGPPVVLLHGLLMDRTMWDPQIEALAGRHRVIAIDAPGHGESAGVDVGIDFWRYAEMVAGVCDQLGIGRAVWGGQSMGGFTSLRAALAMPDRISRLVLIDTQAHAEDRDKLAQYEALLQVGLDSGFNEDLAQIIMVILFSERYAATPESGIWRKKMADADVHAAHAMIRAVFDRDDIHDRVSEIPHPSLVIHGTDDVAIEDDRGRELAEALPNATYISVPDAGHACPCETPEPVSEAILSFLDGS